MLTSPYSADDVRIPAISIAVILSITLRLEVWTATLALDPSLTVTGSTLCRSSFIPAFSISSPNISVSCSLLWQYWAKSWLLRSRQGPTSCWYIIVVTADTAWDVRPTFHTTVFRDMRSGVGQFAHSRIQMKQVCIRQSLHLVCDSTGYNWDSHTELYTAHAVVLTKILSQPLRQNVLFSP